MTENSDKKVVINGIDFDVESVQTVNEEGVFRKIFTMNPDQTSEQKRIEKRMAQLKPTLRNGK